MDKSIEKQDEPMMSKIMQLESVIIQMPQIEIPIEHFFAPGIYMRQMTMPKDSVVTGKIHKTEHMCVLAKGSVAVANENGSKVYTAPAVIHSMPGTKRALHALDEVVWINVHHNPTDEQDLEKIEEIFVVNSFAELEAHEPKKLEGGE